MDFGKAFMFVQEDPDWITKIAVGGLIVLISPLLLGLPAFLLLGYQMAVTRNVMQGEKRPLPAWNNIGQLFMDGLMVGIATFVYSLPVFLLVCIGMGVSILPALGSGNEDVAAALGGVAVLTWVVLACVMILYAVVLAFIAPAIYIQYVRSNGDFGSLFRFGEVLGLARQGAVDILLAIVAVVVANVALQLIVSISAITICGPFILAPAGAAWIAASTGHFYGQIGDRLGGVTAKKAF